MKRSLPYLFFFITLNIAGAAVDTVFVVTGSHLDLGFTDLPSAIGAKRVAILDDAILIAKREPEFRWTEDAAWVIEQWLRVHRGDAARMKALKYLLHNGQISVSAAYLTPHTAVIPELQPSIMLMLDTLQRVLDYRPSVAILNDVATHPQSLIDALAKRGVRYLMIGANMGFSVASLPPKLVRTPFYWESESGARILTYIDPNNYCGAFQLFGLGPGCAKVFNAQRFPASMQPMDVMRKGIADLISSTPGGFDALALQHAYDNWDTQCANDLLVAARNWNGAGNRPIIKLANPAEYFHHIETRYGTKLPVYREEWGGQWDEIRAVSPVWTWRIRQAAKMIIKHPTFNACSALQKAMEHNVHLGEIWPSFFDEYQCRAYADECAAMFREAVMLGLNDAGGATATPPAVNIPSTTTMDGDWEKILAGNAPIRVRSGHWPGTPFVDANAPVWNTPVRYGITKNRVAANVHIDRRNIPGSDRQNVAVVVEIPLHAPLNALRIAPEESRAALRNAWLRPPQFIVAANGVRVIGLSHPITVHAPLIFSWMLVPDVSDRNITWLQGMIVRQTLFCQLRGGGTTVLPFEAWFPGEPSVIDVGVEMKMR